MKATVSLKGNYAFRRLYAKGKNAVRPALVLYCRKNGSQENRLGITVSTKLGKAVKRNLIRRRLREIYRLHEDEICRGYDIVVVARSLSAECSYSVLEADFLKAAGRLKVILP